MRDNWNSKLVSFVLGIVFACAVAFAGTYLHLKFGNPSVAAADPAFPMEA